METIVLVLLETLWKFRVGAAAASACAFALGYLLGPWGGVLGLMCGVWLGVLLEIRLRFGRWILSPREDTGWYYVFVLSGGLFLLAVIVICFALVQAR